MSLWYCATCDKMFGPEPHHECGAAGARASWVGPVTINREAFIDALSTSCLYGTVVDCELTDLIAALRACGVEVE